MRKDTEKKLAEQEAKAKQAEQQVVDENDKDEMMKKIDEERTQKERRPACKDANEFLVKGCTTDHEKLKQLVVKYHALNQDHRVDEGWIIEAKMRPLEEKLKKEDIIELETRRHTDGFLDEVLAKTQVVLKDKDVKNPRCLNKNKIEDFYGDAILLCQSPLEDELFYHFVALREQNVGVAVIVGSFEENNITKYFEDVGKTRIIEEPRGKKRKFKVTTVSSTLKRRGCDTHVLKVEDLNGKSREMVLVHSPNWYDFDVPQEPEGVCRAVLHIKLTQIEQAKKGLPAMAVNCSAGIQRSPTLICVHIGLRCYIETGKVDPRALLEYIRRNRLNVMASGSRPAGEGKFIPLLLRGDAVFAQMRLLAAALSLLIAWFSEIQCADLSGCAADAQFDRCAEQEEKGPRISAATAVNIEAGA